MFKPVYNYKGIPILPTSKNVYRPGKYAKRSHWKSFFLFILLIAVIVFVVWKLSVLLFFEKQEDKPKTPVAVEIVEPSVEEPADSNVIKPEPKTVQPPANQILPAPAPAKPVKVPVVAAVTKTVPAPQTPVIQVAAQTEHTAVTQEQFEARIKIEQMLRQKKYEEARAALEELFKTLPMNTVLYPHAQKLLAIATNGLKEEGVFSNSGTVDYTVANGDSLSKIATMHNTTMSAVMQANGISNPNRLKVGQTLKVPKNTWTGTVFVGRKKLYIYESGKLVRIYSLNIANIPSIPTEGRFTVAGKNPEWNLYGLGLSDIRNLKELIPVGTEIRIER